jgi:hypothetical protein
MFRSILAILRGTVYTSWKVQKLVHCYLVVLNYEQIFMGIKSLYSHKCFVIMKYS